MIDVFSSRVFSYCFDCICPLLMVVDSNCIHKTCLLDSKLMGCPRWCQQGQRNRSQQRNFHLYAMNLAESCWSSMSWWLLRSCIRMLFWLNVLIRYVTITMMKAYHPCDLHFLLLFYSNRDHMYSIYIDGWLWQWCHHNVVPITTNDALLSTKSNQVLIALWSSLELVQYPLYVRNYEKWSRKDRLDSRTSYASCDELFVTLE